MTTTYEPTSPAIAEAEAHTDAAMEHGSVADIMDAAIAEADAYADLEMEAEAEL